jgi:signal transduction histidine kinase
MRPGTQDLDSLPLLALLIEEHREEIIEVGVDWVRAQSQDLRGRRPRRETFALVEREFEVYRALMLFDDGRPRDAFIEYVTSMRAAMMFQISTLLRGFLCFRQGVMYVIEHHAGATTQQRLELTGALDTAYFDTIFLMTDVYTSKLKGALRSAQAELIHKEKMAALGGLVAGVAHEINTPVGVALTASTLLEQRINALEEKFSSGALRRADMRSFLKDAREAARLTASNLHRAGELVSSFKKVAVDQSSEKTRRFELVQYVRDVLTSLGPMYKRGALSVRLEAAAPIEVCTHAGAISQVVTNLLSNALVHAFDGEERGAVVITVRRRSDEEAEVEVADDGGGMTQEVLHRAFEPFYTTTRGQGGSGLGLHIVHNIVTELLRGEVALQTTLGEGTRASVRFPMSLA